eukprot:TRINITY_DN1007_c0_g2_i1.p1 TRINITY_DN1007_c0_g2~~TRINITY_DN1007_c0_g2_i1.p1  ORF type:complete len:159 (-),score=29.94 TRINITY_DN1007_c0_g2_i1:47-523(-)
MTTTKKTGVASVIAVIDPSNGKLLMDMRKDGLAWIGGKVDPGEDFVDCAIRELMEEAGLKLQPSDLNFTVKEHLICEKTGFDWLVSIFWAFVPSGQTAMHMEKDKSKGFCWLTFDELLASPEENVFTGMRLILTKYPTPKSLNPVSYTHLTLPTIYSV